MLVVAPLQGNFHLQKSRCSACACPAVRTWKCMKPFPLCFWFRIWFLYMEFLLRNLDTQKRIFDFDEGFLAIRRKTTRTGRMWYLCNVPPRFKSCFREDLVICDFGSGWKATDYIVRLHPLNLD
ncbi:hypothetical protein RchiOBHm_Chr3g0483621 [Rosa chinensis]|uniref:Uncharacterized protein n=1 Tax=Rosa chinensis TaxID=74649 RepID=A0A2P6REI6_ROSCH|nr:hypothetical protein RchiOBHm_Chr3g0483621 [Rosa chinensis]